MTTLGVVPARGGSTGIPRKNLISVLGRPLLAFTAEAALASRRLSRVILSTDDEEIAAVGRSYGLDAPFLRPAALAKDDTPTLPVLQHAVAWMEEHGARFDCICLLEPTTPLRRAEDIDGCIELLEQSGADAVVTILPVRHNYNPHWVYFRDQDDCLRLSTGEAAPIPRRQNLPPAFHRDGSVYVTRRDVLMEANSLYGKRLIGYPMDPAASVNIDEPKDLELLEHILVSRNRSKPNLTIGNRKIGADYAPLVIAEVGINHEGDFHKAVRMVDDAWSHGCECVKFQCHVVEDEMIPEANRVIPGNASESIWAIMSRCTLSEEEECRLKAYVESKGMIYLCTPFSRAAADRLHRMNVSAYKIGSGECNNYPLVRLIASFGKPVILSTGMNDLESIGQAVQVLRAAGVPFALLHCTSMYPTPYEKVRLGALRDLALRFPDAVLGLSDHSIGAYTCLAAVALGASILEKHFTSDKSWPGPDVPISIDPSALRDLIQGSKAVHDALGGSKTILPEEQPTIDFAYACVVSTADIPAGGLLGPENLWVKRPGTGEIKAIHYEKVLGRKAARVISKDQQIGWHDLA